MHANVGTIDRVLRFLLGAGLVSLVFVGPQTVWGWAGMILVVTSLISWCPIYGALKIKTRKTVENDA